MGRVSSRRSPPSRTIGSVSVSKSSRSGRRRTLRRRRFPAGAPFLYVGGGGGGGEPLQRVIRSPRRVRRIARVINRLPAAQPQFISCPEELGERPPGGTRKFKGS